MRTKEDYLKHTVADLREMLKVYYGVKAPSKARKAELVDMLVEVSEAHRSETVARAVEGFESQLKNVNLDAFRNFKAANAAFAGFVYAVSLVSPPTVEEWNELNEGKYRGRFEGRQVLVATRFGRKVADGTVVDRVHRDGHLLLAVKHAGLPRVTLHKAADVLVY